MESQSAQARPTTAEISQIKQELRENVENLAEDLRERSNRMADNMGDRFMSYYDDATDWFKENYGKTLAVVGALAAVGLIGYAVARSQRKRRM